MRKWNILYRYYQNTILDIVNLNETFFANFQLPSLLDLQFDHTDFGFVTFDSLLIFVGIPNLKVGLLNMSHNFLSAGIISGILLSLENLLYLQNIDMSHQTGPMRDKEWRADVYSPRNLFK